MKKTKLRKKSKSKIPTLKRKLWKVFSLYIRERDSFKCITCGKVSVGQGMHCGHFIPKAVGGMALYFCETNNHAQCYNCNINLGGWGERYAEVLERKYGIEKVNEMRGLIHKIEKWSELDYLNKIEYYKDKLGEDV